MHRICRIFFWVNVIIQFKPSISGESFFEIVDRRAPLVSLGPARHPTPRHLVAYPEQVFTRWGEPIPYPFGYTERLFTRGISRPSVSNRRYIRVETLNTSSPERLFTLNRCFAWKKKRLPRFLGSSLYYLGNSLNMTAIFGILPVYACLRLGPRGCRQNSLGFSFVFLSVYTVYGVYGIHISNKKLKTYTP